MRVWAEAQTGRIEADVSVLTYISVHQPQRPENLRDVKSRTMSRLPDDRLVIRPRALRTEEIDPEGITCGGGTRIHGGGAIGFHSGVPAPDFPSRRVRQKPGDSAPKAGVRVRIRGSIACAHSRPRSRSSTCRNFAWPPRVWRSSLARDSPGRVTCARGRTANLRQGRLCIRGSYWPPAACSGILSCMTLRQVLAVPLAAAAFSAGAQPRPPFTKGILSILFPKEMPRPECFAQAKSAGFDAMEVAIGTDLPLDISHDDARRMADAADTASIHIATLCVSEPLHQNPLNAADPAVRARDA